MSAADEVKQTEEFEETEELTDAPGHDEDQDEKQDEETQEGEIDKQNRDPSQDDDLDSTTTSGKRGATASEDGMKTQHPAKKVETMPSSLTLEQQLLEADAARAVLMQKLAQNGQPQKQQSQSLQTGIAQNLSLQQKQGEAGDEDDLFNLAGNATHLVKVNSNQPAQAVPVRAVHCKDYDLYINKKMLLLIQEVCEVRNVDTASYAVKRKNAAEKDTVLDIRAMDETAPVNVHLWRIKATEFNTQWNQVKNRPGSKFLEIQRFSARSTKESHLTQWMEVDTIDDGKMKGTEIRVFVDNSAKMRLLLPTPPLVIQDFQSLSNQQAVCRVSLVGIVCEVGEVNPTASGDVKAAFEVRDEQGLQASGWALGASATIIKKFQQVQVAFFNMALRRSLKTGKMELWAFNDSYVIPLRRAEVLPDKTAEVF